MNVWKTQPMSFWTNSQYFFRDPRILLFTKQNGVLSYICREFSEVTSHLTLPTARHSQKVGIQAAECQIPSQSRFALINRHFYASLTRTTRWNSRKIVSCVMCDVTTRCQALGVFSENYRKRVILSTLNVNISESQAIFPLKVWHRFASVSHYKMP